MWKQSCDNLFIIRSNLPIRQRINYFICHNSLLEYAESNWWMTDRLLRCSYSASADCNNQSETSVAAHNIWKFQLSYALYRSVRTDISPRISIYNRPLLMITARCWVITPRPQAMYQGWYTLIVWYEYLLKSNSSVSLCQWRDLFCALGGTKYFVYSLNVVVSRWLMVIRCLMCASSLSCNTGRSL